MTPRSIPLGLLLLLAAVAPAFPPDEKKAEPVLLVDAAGKERKLASYRITAGTRRLAWLAKGAKEKAGPEGLVVRDDASIRFLEGVVTLVPLTRLRAVRFDAEKSTMTAVVAAGPKAEDDVSLTGTSKFKGINKIALEAEVDKGDAGVATLTYQGGIVKGGIRSVTFPTPKAEASKPGRPAVVVSVDDDVKKTHPVSDLLALYRLPDGGEQLLPTILFKKTLKVDLAKVKSVAVAPGADEDAVWQVVQMDGEESSLTPVGTLPIDKQTATLVGLVGKVPAGYKLFPLRRIHSIAFDATDGPKEKEPAKDDSR